MLFYPAGEKHSQQFDRNGSHKLIFRPSVSCLKLLTDEKVRLPQAPHVGSTSIRWLANRVVKEMRKADSFSPMVIEGLLLELVATFGRMYGATNQREAIPNWLKQCREMLDPVLKSEQLTKHCHSMRASIRYTSPKRFGRHMARPLANVNADPA